MAQALVCIRPNYIIQGYLCYQVAVPFTVHLYLPRASYRLMYYTL